MLFKEISQVITITPQRMFIQAVKLLAPNRNDFASNLRKQTILTGFPIVFFNPSTKSGLRIKLQLLPYCRWFVINWHLHIRCHIVSVTDSAA